MHQTYHETLPQSYKCTKSPLSMVLRYWQQCSRLTLASMLRTALSSGQSRQLSQGLHHTRISIMCLKLEQMNFSYVFADFVTLKATKTFLCNFSFTYFQMFLLNSSGSNFDSHMWAVGTHMMYRGFIFYVGMFGISDFWFDCVNYEVHVWCCGRWF